MTILTKRLKPSPCDPRYEWCKQLLEIMKQKDWTHTEVSMGTDKMSWESGILSDYDKKCMSSILRGFTVIENIIGDHWGYVARLFPIPEINGMAKIASAQEVVHFYAYDLLETTVGISEQNWELFLHDLPAMHKIEEYQKFFNEEILPVSNDEEGLLKELDTNPDNLKAIAKGLACFGACGEGISLFVNFALLLSYCKDGKSKNSFPGMNQILSWSVRDEDAHSFAAIRLYKHFCEDYPEARLTQYEVEDMFEAAIQLESVFIDEIFQAGELSTGITKEDAYDFLYERADRKITELGYDSPYHYSKLDYVKTSSIAEWFYPLTQNTTFHDFFAQRTNGSAYVAKLNQNFNEVTISI